MRSKPLLRLLLIVPLLSALLNLAGSQPASAQSPDLPQVEAGENETCLIDTAGRLVCFGDTGLEKANVPALPAGVTYTQVTANGSVLMALRSDGWVVRWGQNPNNWLTVPGLPAGVTYTDVSVSLMNACALRSNGTAVCWGDDYNGVTNVPALPAGSTYTTISTGLNTACAMRSDGVAVCWGSNAGTPTPADPGVTYTQIAAGYAVCGLRSDSRVDCWGNDFYQQVSEAPAGAGFIQIDMTDISACALPATGDPFCWGNFPDWVTPPARPAGVSIDYISAGNYDACMRYSDGTAACWGWDNNGEIPNIAITTASLPTGTAGGLYGATLEASGGPTPYSYSLFSGSLPPGLTLYPAGFLVGVPTTPGTYTFQVQVKDGHNVPFTAWKDFSLEIGPAVPLPGNQPPTSADGSVTILEDGTAAFSAASFAFNDTADAINDSLQAVQITSLPAAGTLYLDLDNDNQADSGEALPVGASVTTGYLNQLKYRPAANASGSGYASFQFKVYDGSDFSSAANSMTIHVTAVNDAPTFTVSCTPSILEDSGAHSFACATAIDLEPGDDGGQTGSFSLGAVGAPALFSSGPSVDPATGQISFTPAADASGSTTIGLVLTDSGGTANGGADSSSATLNVTITDVNDAPGFTAGPNLSVLEDSGAFSQAGWATAISRGSPYESGQALSFVITSNSNPGLFSGAPAVNAGTGTLSFTPAANANGSATLTLRLSDNGGTANGGVNQSAEQSFTISVTAVNDAPGFTAGANQSVLEDSGAFSQAGWATAISRGPADESSQALSFVITANSNPGLFSAAPQVDPDSGTLSFTPAANANGSATLTLRLSDNGGTANGGANQSAEQSFTISVTPVNDAPTFVTACTQRALEHSGPLSQAGSATAISRGPADESSQALSFVITANSNPGLFSAAPQVDPDSGTLSFTPAANANGSATLTLRLSDNGGTANGGANQSAEQSFTISVTPVNDAPTFVTACTPTVLEDAGLQSFSGCAASPSAGPPDESGQSLSLALSAPTNPGLFSLLPVLDPLTHALSFTPAANANGSAQVTLTLSDNGGTANGGADYLAQTLTIQVTPVNDAPGFTPGGDVSVAEDAGLQEVANWATGINKGAPNESGQRLTFRFAGNSNPALFSAGPAIDADTGLLSFTPAAGASGQAMLAVYLADDGGTASGGVDRSNTSIFTISVSAANDAPLLADPPDQTAFEGSRLTFQAAGRDTDVPANALRYSLNTDAPGGASIDPTSGVFTWTPAEDQGGQVYELTITVSDDGTPSLSAAQSFQVQVNETNQAPVLAAIPNQAASEGSLVSFTASASDADLPANTLVYQLGGAAPDGATLTPAGQFTWTPGEAQGPGAYNLLVIVSDNGAPAASHSQVVQVTVSEVNQAPSAVGDTYVAVEDTPLSVPAPGVLSNDQDADLPANPLQASLVSGPARGTLALQPDGSFTYTPAPNDNGPQTFTYQVSDGKLSATAQVTLLVAGTGDAPQVQAGADQGGVLEGQVVAFSGSFTQESAAAPTILWDFGDGATSLAVEAGGVVTATHAYANNGVYTVTLTVIDGQGLAGQDTLRVTVSNVAPSVALGDDLLAMAGTPLPFQASFSDPGRADTHTCAWDFGDGQHSSTPCTAAGPAPSHTYAAPGSYSVVLTVQDSDGASGSDSLQVTVANGQVVVVDDGVHPLLGWSEPITTTSPSGQAFLGEFGNQTVTLNLGTPTPLASHGRVQVTFDLYLLRSWDGNMLTNAARLEPAFPGLDLAPLASQELVGPDHWEFRAAGRSLLHTTFSNWEGEAYRQSYPGAYPQGDYPARTGARAVGELGYSFKSLPMDTVYSLAFVFDHSAPTLRLDFSAFGLQDLADESWGLDNLRVTLLNGLPAQLHLYLPVVQH